jgi:hypothetical protein
MRILLLSNLYLQRDLGAWEHPCQRTVERLQASWSPVAVRLLMLRQAVAPKSSGRVTRGTYDMEKASIAYRLRGCT